MKRRTLVSLLGGATLTPLVARGQTRVYRLGMLTPLMPLAADTPPAKFLLEALAQRGYRLGHNLAVTTRGARGQNARLPALMQEFKAEGVDVMVTAGYPPTLAAKE